MFAALLMVIALSVPSFEQNTQSTPISPCPNVFQYEPPGTEPGRWYGVVNLSTDSTLHSLWLNIVLDRKADILGNWVGDVTTTDNIDFKIENTEMRINPGPAVAVRFFVQYNSLSQTPKLRAIRLNGREICNANTPQPAPQGPQIPNNRPPATSSSTSRPGGGQVGQGQQSTPVRGKPTEQGPVYVRPSNSNPNPVSIAGGDSINFGVKPTRRPGANGYPLTTVGPGRNPTRRPDTPSDFDDGSVSNDDNNDDYFPGGQITFTIPTNSGSTNNEKYGGQGQGQGQSQSQGQCGKVTMNKPIPLVVNGTPTKEGQWPWQIALYQSQTVDFKYICGGTLVSHRHVITAAHCVTKKNSHRIVNEKTLTVYLGKHNLRTSVDGVQIKFVDKITVHPEYNASTFSHDLAILELRDPVTYSDWVRPACLWPENKVDLQNVIGLSGSVVGWGFDDTGVATEELSLVEMPVVDQETCLRSYNEFFSRFTSSYTYCAGFRDGTSVCNGDSGGGMVFKSSGTWYLRGLVSLSVARQNEYRCDPSHYVIFTDLAKFLPWLKNNLYDY
ncbi:uncharacterized protein LOC142981710 isoform X2 [Anticarsia gemmatalis]|uniref:uncharacterized protein LOC142981710 isoform X2 n=1 Tax=Anticarsia gemmatalis TaxID=129554 RepID=UPI003F76D0F9